MNRSAFSMIELVLSIVIIAISVMTIPLMLSQSTNNDSFSIMQESILAARTKMGNILTYEWDRNSSKKSGPQTYIRVLDVLNGSDDLNRSVGNFRIGHFGIRTRRGFFDGNSSAEGRKLPSSIVDNSDIIGINDFHQQNVTLEDINSTLDYLRDFNMTTTVSYISDKTDYSLQTVNFDYNISSKASVTDINKSTNIKMIEIFVQSKEGQNFRFRTFSTNIGQSTFEQLQPQDIL